LPRPSRGMQSKEDFLRYRQENVEFVQQGEHEMKVTIVIPTLPGREGMADRAREFYDHSDVNLLQSCRADLDAFEAILDLLRQAETPYVALCGDDDFLLPSGLQSCVEFLEAHPDYEVCHGDALLFAVEGDRPHGRIDWIAPYNQQSCELENHQRRWRAHIGNYSTTAFSLHRTDTLRKAYEFVDAVRSPLSSIGPYEDPKKNRYEWGEYFTSLLPLVKGKMKKLDVLYMMRQCHRAQTTAKWGSGKIVKPPIRAMIEKIAPNLFRQAQFLLRGAKHWKEFSKMRRFVEEQ